MAEQNDRDGDTDRSWWADVVDPVENLRALTDVHGFGRQAAEDLANRLLGDRNGRHPGYGDTRGAAAKEADVSELIRRFRTDAVRAGEVSANLIDNAAALMTFLVGRLPTGPGREPDPTILASVAPGAPASALFWVHNTSAVPIAAVRPHCAPPRSHAGDELPTDSIRFDPPVLDPLPARSSCGIEVAVSVPPDAEPGTYVSVIMVTNVPAMYVPLRIAVEPAEVTG